MSVLPLTSFLGSRPSTPSSSLEENRKKLRVCNDQVFLESQGILTNLETNPSVHGIPLTEAENSPVLSDYSAEFVPLETMDHTLLGAHSRPNWHDIVLLQSAELVTLVRYFLSLASMFDAKLVSLSYGVDCLYVLYGPSGWKLTSDRCHLLKLTPVRENQVTDKVLNSKCFWIMSHAKRVMHRNLAWLNYELRELKSMCKSQPWDVLPTSQRVAIQEKQFQIEGQEDQIDLMEDVQRELEKLEQVDFENFRQTTGQISFDVHSKGQPIAYFLRNKKKDTTIIVDLRKPEFEYQMDVIMGENADPTNGPHDMIPKEPVSLEPMDTDFASTLHVKTLIQRPDTGTQSDQALDEVAVVPGTTVDRVTSEVETPSGVQTAVHMTNGQTISLQTQEWLPYVSLPEWGNVWGITTKTDNVYTGRFSERTQRLMKFFDYYNSLVVWRIIGKLPMFSSQRFWVSFVPEGSSSQGLDNLGFEWNPSEQPEIYVVTPWTHPGRLLSVGGDVAEKLAITPMTDMVYTEGLPAQTDLDVYCAPLDMKLYVPRIVKESTSIPPRNFKWISSASAQGNTFDNEVVWAPSFLVDGNVIEGQTITATSGSGDTMTAQVSATGEITITSDDLTGPLDTEWTFDVQPAGATGVIVCVPEEPLSYFYMEWESSEGYEQQMKEYQYNENFDHNVQDYGQTNNHTERVDRQWGILQKVSWQASDRIKVISLANPTTRYPLQDLVRHLFYSKHPLIKVLSTSIPTVNKQFRLTQIPYGTSTTNLTVEDLLQLPGIEFDPKMGPVDFTPYWDRFAPGAFVDEYDTQNTNVALMSLGGSQSVEPIEFTFMYNCKGMDYHHLNNRNPDEPLIEFEQQMETSPIKTTTQSGKGVDDLTHSATTSERKWTYLNSYSVPTDVAAFQIPINTCTLGKQFYHHARRYTMWRGTPHFRVVMHNSRLTNVNLHVCQTNKLFDSPVNPAILLDNIGYAVTATDGCSVDYPVQWRNISAYVPIDNDETTPALGYLSLIFPSSNWADPATAANIGGNISLSLYVDPSSVEMKGETGPGHVGKWALPPTLSSARDTASFQILSAPEVDNLC